MAESMNKAARSRVVYGAAILGIFFAGYALAVESLPDPTRPPASLSASVNHGPAVNAGPVLQSVLISAGRRVAVISGQTVQTGGKVGDARVIRIAENEVVLANGKDLQTLKLFPGIEKQLETKNEAAKANSRRQ